MQALADTSRPGMREVFVRLRSLGIARTIMLTGDNQEVAMAVAAAVGISGVRARLLPEEKLKVIDQLMRCLRQLHVGLFQALIRQNNIQPIGTCRPGPISLFRQLLHLS